jgi:hypothetical protein
MVYGYLLCKLCRLTLTPDRLQCRRFKPTEKVMKTVASTDAYTIVQRKDGRYAVVGADKKPINAEEKVAILLEHGLITAPTPKAPEPEPEAEAETETEAAADDAGEAEASEKDAEDGEAS